MGHKPREESGQFDRNQQEQPIPRLKNGAFGGNNYTSTLWILKSHIKADLSLPFDTPASNLTEPYPALGPDPMAL